MTSHAVAMMSHAKMSHALYGLQDVVHMDVYHSFIEGPRV